MSKAFTREDHEDADNSALMEAYARQRIAELGGGDYEKGKALLATAPKRGVLSQATPGSLPAATLDPLLPPAIHKDGDMLDRARRRARQMRGLAGLVEDASRRRERLVKLLTSLEQSSDESIARGARAYGEYAQAIRSVKLALARPRRTGDQSTSVP